MASPDAALGRSTAIVWERATKRAVTMKMMSSTSVTSTSGVTLMPVMADPTRRLLATLRLLDVREQNVTERLGVAERRGEQTLKVVEHCDRRDRHHQTDGSRHERFGDGAHHALRRESASVEPRATPELVERAYDTDHRAEQPDERRVVPDRAQEQQTALEPRPLDAAR